MRHDSPVHLTFGKPFAGCVQSHDVRRSVYDGSNPSHVELKAALDLGGECMAESVSIQKAEPRQTRVTYLLTCLY